MLGICTSWIPPWPAWLHRDCSLQTRRLGRLRLPLIGRAEVMLFIVAMHGFEMRHLRAVYAAHAHGWVFPPAWPGVNWGQDIVDESAAIRLFDRLRLDGAKWFGIIAEQRTRHHDTLPRLVAHIENTTELVDQNHDWSIYRILSLKPESRLNDPRLGSL